MPARTYRPVRAGALAGFNIACSGDGPYILYACVPDYVIQADGLCLLTPNELMKISFK